MCIVDGFVGLANQAEYRRVADNKIRQHAYQTYTQRARFSEVVTATTAVKTAVEICGQTAATATTFNANCIDGSNGVSNVAASGNVASVAATAGANADEVIVTATAQNLEPVGTGAGAQPTYIMTGTLANGQITWAVTGTCVAAGLCSD
ncbi:pilin [uncultured Endozoicomonas sp.]|uniref:pilin n=1 Tax=uncultured Endozoicomonas sp. TaxID=432652 RepID=UPI0026049B2D|nr:pilin [uncultured Endozoicomonas sp.]